MKIFKVVAIIACIAILSACAPSAQHELAKGRSAYLNQQYQLSYLHIRNAAQAGDPDAQYALGYMYYYGRGIGQDEAQAKYWIGKAAAQGQPLAQTAMRDLNLTPATPKPAAALKSATITPAPHVVKQYHEQIKPALKAPRQMVVKKQRVTKSKHKYTATEKYLLAKPKHNYTIQLLGSYYAKGARNFIMRNKITHKARYYRTTHNGRDWYVVVYGVYPNAQIASNVMHKLSVKIRVTHPWVKSLKRVQTEISQ